jgi:DNA end-binding protein Ku
VPVRIYAAIEERDLRFHYVHAKDGGRMAYQKICRLEGKPVPDEEIVKAYEVDDELVYVTDEDFEAARVDGYHTIGIEVFVPLGEIDPIYFERTFYLGPGEGAEGVYGLLLRAMSDAGLAAVTRFVMRDREHLGCLRVREGILVLEKLYFADKIREVEPIRPQAPTVRKGELEMAAELIERFTGRFEPERYEDTYRAALLDVIERKRQGKETRPAKRASAKAPPDLMEALRQSIDAAKEREPAAPPKLRSSGRSSAGRRRRSKRTRT